MAHRWVVCFIESSLAHKRNVIAAPASSKRKLGRITPTPRALEDGAQVGSAPSVMEYPGPARQRRLMPDMLIMATFELGDPVARSVAFKPHDSPFPHVTADAP